MRGNLNMGGNFILMSVFIVLGLAVVIGVLTGYAFSNESGYMDYIYSSATNITATPFINTSVNGTQTLVIGDISRDIKGETKIETVQIYTENTDTTNRDITVYLNSVSIGTITAINQSNTSTTFENLDYAENSINTLLYVPVANVGSDLKVLNATGVYPSDNEDVKFDSLFALIIGVLSICMVVTLVVQTLNKLSK